MVAGAGKSAGRCEPGVEDVAASPSKADGVGVAWLVCGYLLVLLRSPARSSTPTGLPAHLISSPSPLVNLGARGRGACGGCRLCLVGSVRFSGRLLASPPQGRLGLPGVRADPDAGILDSGVSGGPQCDKRARAELANYLRRHLNHRAPQPQFTTTTPPAPDPVEPATAPSYDLPDHRLLQL